LVHLEELFKKFHEVNMKIHPKKCEFVVTSIVYLRYKILPNGIMAHWAKVVAILEMPNPTDVHTLRSFIGLCNYYRIYVQDFSTIVHSLYALLKKDVVWTWSEEAQETFNTFKEKLSKFPIVRRPDFNKVFILHTDWNAFGMGVVLGQLDEEGKEYVIAYASRSNNKAESNYSSYEGECFVVVWAIIHFRPYLYDTKFNLYIDHQPIKWLMTNNKLTSKLARWALILEEYEFKVIHQPSITHQNTDTMLRRPFTTSEDFLEVRQDFDQIPIIHVFYASSYLTLLQCLVKHPIVDIWEDFDTLMFLEHGDIFPKLHQVIGNAYNNSPNDIHGGTIISFDAYHKATKWFFHHMNGLVLFRMYTWSLDILELNVLIAFLLLITIGGVCMLKSKMSLLGVNNVIE
jgi:hypothetical protein